VLSADGACVQPVEQVLQGLAMWLLFVASVTLMTSRSSHLITCASFCEQDLAAQLRKMRDELHRKHLADREARLKQIPSFNKSSQDKVGGCYCDCSSSPRYLSCLWRFFSHLPSPNVAVAFDVAFQFLSTRDSPPLALACIHVFFSRPCDHRLTVARHHCLILLLAPNS
jgi:hypothetical protein